MDVNAAGCRLAHYPAQSTDARPGQLRYGAHIASGGVPVLSLNAMIGARVVDDARSGEPGFRR